MMQILRYDPANPQPVLARAAQGEDVAQVVQGIIARVRQQGDAALREYTRQLDHVSLESLEVTASERQEALQQIDPQFLQVLRQSHDQIARYHSRQLHPGFVITEQEGIVLGQKVTPIARVGLYVPGGTAAYPSSVLMNCVPARLAGVEEIVMVTPPGRDGKISPAILAAAQVAGVGRIFKVGGAQAVAALAYGTESIPRVDKIVGPGNAYVAEAKKQVFGQVAIDMVAGPSEILIVADSTARPAWLAADLLAQAEHDRMASAVLITNDAALARSVQQEVERQLPALSRQEIARASIETNGKIILVDSIAGAVALANQLAPEHLEMCVQSPLDYLSQIRNAGSIFLGHYCPEALGDYWAGPNHTLPTGGTARFSSPLSVDDFVKKSAFTYYTAEALQAAAPSVARFARQEGLTAHALSALCREVQP